MSTSGTDSTPMWRKRLRVARWVAWGAGLSRTQERLDERTKRNIRHNKQSAKEEQKQ